MVLTVHVEQDDPLHVDVLADHIVGELRESGVGPRVVDVAAAGDLLDVLVLGDHPVATVVEPALADLLLAPPHRGDLAQFGQLVDSRTTLRSGSRKSNPAGKWGDGMNLLLKKNMTCSSASKTRLHHRKKASRHPRLSED